MLPLPSAHGTDIGWAFCPQCGSLYPNEEDYAVEKLSAEGQVRALVEYACDGVQPGVGVSLRVGLGRRDRQRFVTWRDMGQPNELLRIVRRQAARIAALLRLRFPWSGVPRWYAGGGRRKVYTIDATLTKLRPREPACPNTLGYTPIIHRLHMSHPLIGVVCERHFPSFPVVNAKGYCTGELVNAVDLPDDFTYLFWYMGGIRVVGWSDGADGVYHGEWVEGG
jgi:hypothetical protein